MLLFYIRHGQPTYCPNELTPLGKRQAEEVAKRLAAHGIDEIYASSSNRAYQTAIPTSEITGKPIVSFDWCTEENVWEELVVDVPDKGRFWLFQYDETRRKLLEPDVIALGKKWYDSKKFSDPRIKKGMQRIERETYAFLKSLGYEHDDKTNTYTPINHSDKRVAFFAHAGFGMAFLSTVLDIPYPLFSTHCDIGHTGVTVIRFTPDNAGRVVPCMLQLANDSHLFRSGLPTKYNDEIYF